MATGFDLRISDLEFGNYLVLMEEGFNLDLRGEWKTTATEKWIWERS